MSTGDCVERSPDPGCLRGLAWVYRVSGVGSAELVDRLEARAPEPGRRADEQLGDETQPRLILPYRCEVRVSPGQVRLFHRISADEQTRRQSEEWLETAIRDLLAEARVPVQRTRSGRRPAAQARVRTEPAHGEPVYLDCNGSTPLAPEVIEAMRQALAEPGNPGPDHWHGRRAAQRVRHARECVAALVGRPAESVVWTGCATEANNLALLGLAGAAGERRRHVVTTAIEHPSVLGPVGRLRERGFEVELVPPGPGGAVSPDDVLAAIRPDTLVVSVMHANNVTGARQPVEAIASGLAGHPAFLHVDAAQSYGKDLVDGAPERIDLLTVTAHKIYGPVGIAALVLGPRVSHEALSPLTYGGRQEGGLRPGTESLLLLAGFAAAAQAAALRHRERAEAARAFRSRLLGALAPLRPVLIGDQNACQPHVVCLAVPGVEASVFQATVAPWMSVGTGAACTSGVSPTLEVMGLDAEVVAGAVRLSWWEGTPDPDYPAVVAALNSAVPMSAVPVRA